MMTSLASFDRSHAIFTARAATPGYNVSSNPINSDKRPQLPSLSITLPPLSSLNEKFPQISTRPHIDPPRSGIAWTNLSQKVDTAVETDSPCSVSCVPQNVSAIKGTHPSKEEKKRRVSAKSEACREQCRTNQARYRKKQREYVSKLESTVAQLRDEIPHLEVQRRRLRYDSHQRVCDVVIEYFQLFRYGVSDTFDQGSSKSVMTSEAHQQLMFLRSTMAVNVEFDNLCGVDVLMQHWRRLSECHANLEFQLIDLKKLSESIVTATATLSVTITKTTLEYIFPHLIKSDSVEDLSLAVKLLGHKVEYPCSMLFVWDEITCLVVRMETDINMVTPLLKLLRNIKDVSRVVEGAIMVAMLTDY